MARTRVIIIGAAGRDFQNFNVLFRNNRDYDVVAFTANQIPYISDRKYPPQLSGPLYPEGIQIYDESKLPELIERLKAQVCILAYSDLPYETVMEKASLVNACGADFWLVAPSKTMIKSTKPIISVCAVRTGAGKSQTSRYIAKYLRSKGLKVSLVRHPMPYGILKDEIVERFRTVRDLDKYKTTIEEREDYEPHIRNGFVVFAGVDYERILRAAEKESDVIIWDGGNNDASFYKPDLSIAVVDPLRAGNEISYYPGETVARMADVILVNKMNSATKEEVQILKKDIDQINPDATVIYADSVVSIADPDQVRRKSALIIEDGPTITHGGMKFGAGTVAAKQYGVRSVVNAKQYAVGEIRKTFERYPRLGKELPAMGYSKKQIKDLESTINRAKCDIVISATPTDLSRILKSKKTIVNVKYELSPRGTGLNQILDRFIKGLK
ncbi:MAG: GTPase [Candidatus Micrarchaeota archaeon]|nr:GTPase [Candidatus Micrarchaeota archaeon]